MKQGHAKAGIPAPTPDGSDFYETPAGAVNALLIREVFPRFVWEPAAGLGAISKVLRANGHSVFESDIVEHPGRDPRHPLHVSDFLDSRAPVPAHCGAIITNPPFSRLTEFMVRARDVGVRKVALLIPLTALSGAERFGSTYQHFPPCSVYVFARRLPFRRHGYEGKLSPVGMHAWAVWDFRFTVRGATRLDWINERIEP